MDQSRAHDRLPSTRASSDLACVLCVKGSRAIALLLASGRRRCPRPFAILASVSGAAAPLVVGTHDASRRVDAGTKLLEAQREEIGKPNTEIRNDFLISTLSWSEYLQA